MLQNMLDQTSALEAEQWGTTGGAPSARAEIQDDRGQIAVNLARGQLWQPQAVSRPEDPPPPIHTLRRGVHHQPEEACGAWDPPQKHQQWHPEHHRARAGDGASQRRNLCGCWLYIFVTTISAHLITVPNNHPRSKSAPTFKTDPIKFQSTKGDVWAGEHFHSQPHTPSDSKRGKLYRNKKTDVIIYHLRSDLFMRQKQNEILGWIHPELFNLKWLIPYKAKADSCSVLINTLSRFLNRKQAEKKGRGWQKKQLLPFLLLLDGRRQRFTQCP